MSTIKVFKLDGTLLCGMGEEITLEEMGEKLKMLGGEILEQEKRTVPYMISPVCGTPTGAANVYTITKASWEMIKRGILGTLGFSIWVFDTPTILVYKYDGTLQCGMGKEVKLEEMALELASKKVKIHNQYKSNDGIEHIKMCGASTGSINVFEIDSIALNMALELGFAYLMNKEIVNAMRDVTQLLGEGGFKINLSSGDGGETPPFPLTIVGGDDPPFPW